MDKITITYLLTYLIYDQTSGRFPVESQVQQIYRFTKLHYPCGEENYRKRNELVGLLIYRPSLRLTVHRLIHYHHIMIRFVSEALQS